MGFQIPLRFAFLLGTPVEVNGRVGRVMGRTVEAEPRYEVRFTDGSTEQEVPAAKVWPLAKEE